MDTFTRVKESLPNFPDDVICQWIAPFAETEGWPPSANHQRWPGILRKKEITFWKTVHWELNELHISINALEQKDMGMINDLVLANVVNEINLYSLYIPSSKERFWKICNFIKEHGVYPKPVIVMASNGRYSLLDGSHRFAAWSFLYGYYNLDHPDVPCLKVSDKQKYWVAQPEEMDLIIEGLNEIIGG